MMPSLSEAVVGGNQDFSVWDSISYSDSSLPFGDILSADQVRELFADNDALFGSGENDVWNTALSRRERIRETIAELARN